MFDSWTRAKAQRTPREMVSEFSQLRVLRALRGERILTTKDTKVSKDDNMTRAKEDKKRLTLRTWRLGARMQIVKVKMTGAIFASNFALCTLQFAFLNLTFDISLPIHE
jgi:hypothetical protein